MGNMGSKLRKGRAAYAKSVADKQKALRTQEGYVRDYNRLLGMGPNPPTSRKLMSAGKRGRPDAWAEGFSFVSEWDYANRHRHSTFGHRSMNQWHYATNYRPVSSYPGLLEEFKQKALKAEMTGIPEAKAAIAGIKPMDLSYISSSRKSSRNEKAKAANKAKKEKAERIETYGWDPYETDNFFGTKRDEKGQVVQHDASTYLDVNKMSPEKKKEFTTNLMESVAMQSVPLTIQKQQKEEDQLEKELESVNKKLDSFKTKQTDRYGNQYYKVTAESQRLTDKKSDLEKKLQDINNDQAVASRSLESLDYNTMMRYLAKQDVITDKTRKNYLQYSDPSLATLEQEVQAANYAYQQQKTKTSATSSEIKHLEYLQKNNMGGTKTSEIDNFVLGLENKYGDSIMTKFDTTAPAGSTTVAGVLQQLNENILPDSQRKQSGLRKEQLSASSALSKEETTKQRNARATAVNKETESKRKFEQLTGMEAGSSADQTMQDWYDTIGRTRPDKTMQGYTERDSNPDWFGGWLTNDTMLQRDTDLTLWGEQDKSGYHNLSHKKNVLRKYDEWENANKYISEDLHALKGDLNQYYGSFYSSPSVTKQDVSKAWFGSPTIEGDSFVGHVNQQMGGIRGGAYWVQDVRKLLRKTKEHEVTMKEKIDDRKTKLIELQLEQSRLDEAHRSLRPEITTAVEKGVKHGSGGVDDALQKRLVSSSQTLYDTNELVAITKTEQEYLEKSLKKTIEEREELEKQRKVREYNQLQGNVGSGSPKRSGYSSPGRPSLKQVSRTSTGSSGINTQQSKKRARRKEGLGGLVT